MTLFQKLREYINSRGIGTYVTRQELLWNTYGDPHKSRSTVDKWRRQLTVTGYLQDYPNRRGLFRVLKRIPISVTTTSLETEYKSSLPDYYKRVLSTE